MMCRTSRSVGQPLRCPKSLIKLITLSLRAVVLPVGRIRMGEGPLQLIHQIPPLLIRLKLREKLFSLSAPVYAAMLLARTTDTADAVERGLGLLKALEDEVEGFKPHGNGRKNLTIDFVYLDTLLDAIFGAEVAVKVDLSGGNNGEVGLDYDCCVRRRLLV